MIEERYSLSLLRIKKIGDETIVTDPYRDFFVNTSDFLIRMDEEYERVQSGRIKSETLSILEKENRKLYEELLGEAYESSYANPQYCVRLFGMEYGQLFSFLYTEMRALIVYAYEQDQEAMAIRMELFLEIYHSFYFAWYETSVIGFSVTILKQKLRRG